MDDIRQKRILSLVRRVNQFRRRQRQKIDILCNDIVGTHDNFLENLRSLKFAADFYEELLGLKNIDDIVEAAGNFFKLHIPNTSSAIVLSDSNHSEFFNFPGNERLEKLGDFLSEPIDKSIVRAVCESNKVCNLHELYGFGLLASPAIMKKLSLAAMSLRDIPGVEAMVLFYRESENRLRNSELSRAASVMPGLAKAIRLCRQPSVRVS